jgi:hypothetical protein
VVMSHSIEMPLERCGARRDVCALPGTGTLIREVEGQAGIGSLKRMPPVAVVDDACRRAHRPIPTSPQEAR